MRAHVFSAVTAAILLSACTPAPPPPPPAPDAAAIRTALLGEMAKFGPAFQKRDAAAVSMFFTEDGTWILPDATTMTGRPAIEAGAKAFMELFESADVTGTVIDKLIIVSDNEVVTFAHGNLDIVMKGKKTPEHHLNPFADHWKKGADGVWRIAFEVNAEGPAAAPAPAAKK